MLTWGNYDDNSKSGCRREGNYVLPHTQGLPLGVDRDTVVCPDGLPLRTNGRHVLRVRAPKCRSNRWLGDWRNRREFTSVFIKPCSRLLPLFHLQ